MFSWLLKKKFKYPHEVFPEIALWEEYDCIVDVNQITEYQFVKVMEDGTVILNHFRDLKKVSLSRVMWMTNKSLKNRRIKEEIKKDDYMQFLRDFQRAYKEAKQ